MGRVRKVQRAWIVALALALALPLSVTPAGAGEDDPFGDDTIAVGLSESATPTIDVTVELSRATFPDAGANTVLIGRSDVFADSLASGVLQDEGPLLLVPTEGPVPPAVMEEIDRIGATRAIVLGGPAAVSDAVVQELEAAQMTVERAAGATRTETAVAVARQRPNADTALLARAGGVEGNPTSGFADALAAGGWAAEEGWPVLLTETASLNASTASYLQESGITRVNIVGGTAAISAAVEQSLVDMGMQVARVAGASRVATALQVAAARGAQTAAAADRVIVVDGFSEDAWAAGFAAAAMSAGGAIDVATRQRQGRSAPIVLASDASLPAETADFLVPGPGRMTCAVSVRVCDAAREEVGFDPVVPVEVPVGALVYGTANGDRGQVRAATFDGEALGFVHTCPDSECGEMDWTERGDLMALHETGAALTYFRIEDGAPAVADRRANDQIQDVVDLSEVPDDPRVLYHQRSTQCTGTPLQAGGGCNGGVNARDRAISTLQSMAAHAGAPDAEQLSTALYREDTGQLLLFTVRSFEGFDYEPAQVQIRPGAQLIGSALDPAGSGDIAIVDAVAGVGLLRIAPWPDGDVVSPDLAVVSDPYWLPGGDTVVVIAEVDGTNQLVAVDADTGATEVLVDDAGPDIAQRVEADASGTLIAWRTGNEIRVVNTADSSVATITPPDGQTIVAGPSFRPSA